MDNKVPETKRVVTGQHTYTFPTGESVTLYVSDTKDGFARGLAFNHKEENIHWSSYYEGILYIKSRVSGYIWYIALSGYWDSEDGIPVERVMMVSDCNTPR